MSDLLKKENLKEGVSILTLNRPEVLNSLNKELIDALTRLASGDTGGSSNNNPDESPKTPKPHTFGLIFY